MRIFALVDGENGRILSQIFEELDIEHVVASSISSPDAIPDSSILVVDSEFFERLNDKWLSKLKSKNCPVIFIGGSSEIDNLKHTFDEVSGLKKGEIIQAIERCKKRTVKKENTGEASIYDTLSLDFSGKAGIIILDRRKRIVGLSKNFQKFKDTLERYFRKLDLGDQNGRSFCLKLNYAGKDCCLLYSIAQAGEMHVGILADITDFALETDLIKLKNSVFESALDISDTPVVVHENGRVVLCNRSAERLFGDEIYETDFFDFFTPKMKKSVMRGILSLRYSGRDKFEIETAIHSKGRKIEVSLSTVLLKSGSRWLYVSVFRDITEKRKVIRLIKSLFKIYDFISIFKNKKFILQTAVSELEKEYRKVFIAIKRKNRYEIIKGKDSDTEISDEYRCVDEIFGSGNEPVDKKHEKFVECLKRFSEVDSEIFLSPLKMGGKTTGYLVIFSEDHFGEEESRILEAISLIISHAHYRHELEDIKHIALKQLENNIREFSKIIDRIKNPLAVISGYCELHEDVDSPEIIFSKIREETKRMTHLLENVEKNWETSEKILNRIEKIMDGETEDRN